MIVTPRARKTGFSATSTELAEIEIAGGTHQVSMPSCEGDLSDRKLPEQTPHNFGSMHHSILFDLGGSFVVRALIQGILDAVDVLLHCIEVVCGLRVCRNPLMCPALGRMHAAGGLERQRPICHDLRLIFVTFAHSTPRGQEAR